MDEKIAIENTLKLLKRGKWEMQGDEILAFHQCFIYWLKRLEQLKKPEINIIPEEKPIQNNKRKK